MQISLIHVRGQYFYLTSELFIFSEPRYLANKLLYIDITALCYVIIGSGMEKYVVWMAKKAFGFDILDTIYSF